MLALFSAVEISAAPPNPKKLVDQGALLLDVRSEVEFKEQHIAGAINIPLDDLVLFIDELGSKKRPVVVYCQSGGRSKVAAELLRKHGFAIVVDLGAMKAWSSHASEPYTQR
jgi:rhodanese-related sulfurtransferase